MEYKAIGYFYEGNIWSGGKLLPPRKCPVIHIDTGDRNLNEIGPEETIRVLSGEQNWYTIKRSELVLESETAL